jgi:RNA polymerase sigma-70 factor, ECF subfamily
MTDELQSHDSLETESDPTAAFLEVYSHNYPRLQYYLKALLPMGDDAADVLQETSLVLWKKFQTYETGTNFFAWACKIARLQAMKHRERRGKSGRMFSGELLDMLADEAAAEQLAPDNSIYDLRQCVERLPIRDQEMIRKRYEPGVTVSSLAADIGRTANSLSKTLGRIRRMLLDCIQRKQAAAQRE